MLRLVGSCYKALSLIEVTLEIAHNSTDQMICNIYTKLVYIWYYGFAGFVGIINSSLIHTHNDMINTISLSDERVIKIFSFNQVLQSTASHKVER